MAIVKLLVIIFYLCIMNIKNLTQKQFRNLTNILS